jgi:hypothetical protein
MKQFLITPAAGKRLIAKTLANHPAIKKALKNGTLVIVAGTTNGYIAEEIFRTNNISNDFSRIHFFRGITLPPTDKVTNEGRLEDESKFPGEVVITKGVWQKGKTIADVVDALKEGDVILKGANALDLTRKLAAILIGHPKAGTIGLALPAVVGRRVKLIIPVGIEKRINGRFVNFGRKAQLTWRRWVPFAACYWRSIYRIRRVNRFNSCRRTVNCCWRCLWRRRILLDSCDRN